MKPVEIQQKETAIPSIPSTCPQAEATMITRKWVQRSQSTCALQQAASAFPSHAATITSTSGTSGIETSDRNAFGGEITEATTIRRLVRNRSACALIGATHGLSQNKQVTVVDREQRATLTLTPRSLLHDSAGLAGTSSSINESNKRTTITLEQTLKEDAIPRRIPPFVFACFSCARLSRDMTIR